MILWLGLLPLTVKPAMAYFHSDCVLIRPIGLLLPWPDLLGCVSRVLMRLSRKARGVTGGLADNYPSAPFHLTMVSSLMSTLATEHSRKVDQ